MKVDWSVCIWSDRRQFDLPVPFFFFFNNFSESCHKKRCNEIAFVMMSHQPRSITSGYFERSQDGWATCPGGPAASRHHPSRGRMLGASYERRMESQKLRELVQCLPVTVTSMCFTKACGFSFPAPLWGRKFLLPLLQKKKVRHEEIKLFSWDPTGILW